MSLNESVQSDQKPPIFFKLVNEIAQSIKQHQQRISDIQQFVTNCNPSMHSFLVDNSANSDEKQPLDTLIHATREQFSKICQEERKKVESEHDKLKKLVNNLKEQKKPFSQLSKNIARLRQKFDQLKVILEGKTDAENEESKNMDIDGEEDIIGSAQTKHFSVRSSYNVSISLKYILDLFIYFLLNLSL